MFITLQNVEKQQYLIECEETDTAAIKSIFTPGRLKQGVTIFGNYILDKPNG